MRILKLQLNGTDLKWDEEVANFCLENLKEVDCIALGRKTAEDFIPYWADVANNPTNPEYKIEKLLGRPLNDIPKVVFSKKLKTSKWENAIVLNGDVAENMKTLKKKKGKEIIVYGGYSFVSSLIKHGLIDEYYLLANPLAVGSEQPIFNTLNNLKLRLEECRPFECGTVMLYYKPLK